MVKFNRCDAKALLAVLSYYTLNTAKCKRARRMKKRTARRYGQLLDVLFRSEVLFLLARIFLVLCIPLGVKCKCSDFFLPVLSFLFLTSVRTRFKLVFIFTVLISIPPAVVLSLPRARASRTHTSHFSSHI